MKLVAIALFFLAFPLKGSSGEEASKPKPWNLSDKEVTKNNLKELVPEGLKHFTESGLPSDQAKQAVREAIENKLSAGCESPASSYSGSKPTPKILPKTIARTETCDVGENKAILSDLDTFLKNQPQAQTPASEVPPATTTNSGPTSPSVPATPQTPKPGSVAANPPIAPPSSGPGTTPASGPTAQIPKGGSAGYPPSNTAPKAPPSLGPLSPNPNEPGGAESPQGIGHGSGSSYSVSYEAPASPKKASANSDSESPSAKRTAFTTPALVASNFSIAKAAMDEKIASGAVSPAVADALLARLKPVLETEPNLVKALDTVHESIKQKSVSSDPLSNSSEKLQSAVSDSRVAAETKAPVSASPLATGSSKESASPAAPSARTPVTAPGLILASAALLQRNEALSEAAKSGSQTPSKKPGEKTEPSLTVKSAGILSPIGNPSGSYFPPLPSKALSNGATKLSLETPAKPNKAKVKGILARIASLFSGKSVNDHTKARAISSLGTQTVQSENVSHDASLALASVGSSGLELEPEPADDGYDQEFLAVGLGAFGTCFSGALLGFVFWYRKRQKRVL